jgi:hypothetical protein
MLFPIHPNLIKLTQTQACDRLPCREIVRAVREAIARDGELSVTGSFAAWVA